MRNELKRLKKGARIEGRADLRDDIFHVTDADADVLPQAIFALSCSTFTQFWVLARLRFEVQIHLNVSQVPSSNLTPQTTNRISKPTTNQNRLLQLVTAHSELGVKKKSAYIFSHQGNERKRREEPPRSTKHKHEARDDFLLSLKNGSLFLPHSKHKKISHLNMPS